MICPEYLTPALHRVFTRIHQERMQGVPMLNPSIQVQCVGFRTWQSHCLGVLITPWFMSLMLLPCEGGEWQELRIGDKVTQVFPSGSYEFIVGEEEGLGRYLSCSLFSPVFEFDSQEAAVATAEAVMSELMDEQNRETLSMREKEIERIWRGNEEHESPPSTDEELLETPSLEEKLETSISRRDLLRGRFRSQRPEQDPERG